jgi:CelD/BcsL family acetyltransferase involved in cellulose biosynthesis
MSLIHSGPSEDRVTVVPEAAMEQLETEWDDLAVRSGAPAFVRPGWIRAWRAAFGRGELLILTSRSAGDLRAVLPLIRTRGALRSCSNVHTPVFDGVCARRVDLVTILAVALAEGGGRLILSQLDRTGNLAAAARELGERERFRLAVLNTRVSPYVAPTVNWDDFERAMTSKRRKELRRTARRLSETGELEFETVDAPADLDRCLGEFFDLEGSGWKVDRGTALKLAPATHDFYEQVAGWAAGNGLLRLTFLRLDGMPLAVEFAIDDGKHRHVLKVGYRPEFSRFGPGVLLQFDEIRSALADRRAYELGAGVDAMKQEISNGERTIDQLAIFSRSPRGTAARWTFAARHAIYHRARRNRTLRRCRDAARRLRRGG